MNYTPPPRPRFTALNFLQATIVCPLLGAAFAYAVILLRELTR